MKTNYKIHYKTSRAIVWHNGRSIDWNSDKLRLSKMIPNGCDPTFYYGQLYDIERAVNEILSPFTGYVGWEQKAPIGAVIISRLIDVVSMHSSCHTYGDDFKTTPYYHKYIVELVEIGLTITEATKEVDKLYSIFNSYFKNNTKIYYNVAECEGTPINGTTAKPVELAIIIDPTYRVK